MEKNTKDNTLQMKPLEHEELIVLDENEKARLREAQKLTHKERFLIFTKLMRISLMLQNAKKNTPTFY
jgi:hypothetical protein